MILAIIFAVLTAIILIIGIFAMARGGDFNRKHSTKLMSMRVGLQALVFIILIIFYFL
ncbi:MAG: hypothetical protein DGJ47_000062 [Rickettsiaceae bacterium]